MSAHASSAQAWAQALVRGRREALRRATRSRPVSRHAWQADPTAGAAPVMLLTTTGRRSGRVRTTPVMYVRDGERLVVSSENFGQERPAAWPLNLRAIRGDRADGSGSDLPGTAPGRRGGGPYWPRLVELWPAHETYLARSGIRCTSMPRTAFVHVERGNARGIAPYTRCRRMRRSESGQATVEWSALGLMLALLFATVRLCGGE